MIQCGLALGVNGIYATEAWIAGNYSLVQKSFRRRSSTFTLERFCFCRCLGLDFNKILAHICVPVSMLGYWKTLETAISAHAKISRRVTSAIMHWVLLCARSGSVFHMSQKLFQSARSAEEDVQAWLHLHLNNKKCNAMKMDYLKVMYCIWYQKRIIW